MGARWRLTCHATLAERLSSPRRWQMSAMASLNLSEFKTRQEVDQALEAKIPVRASAPAPQPHESPQTPGIRQFVLQNLVYSEDPSDRSKMRLTWRCNLPVLRASMPQFNQFEQTGCRLPCRLPSLTDASAAPRQLPRPSAIHRRRAVGLHPPQAPRQDQVAVPQRAPCVDRRRRWALRARSWPR